MSFCIKARPSSKWSIWKWFLILVQKKLTLPRFEIESLWNSEKAYRSLFRVNEIVVVRMRGQWALGQYFNTWGLSPIVSQNNKTAAMLVSQTSPLEVELFSYANDFFCYNKFAYMLATWVKILYSVIQLNRRYFVLIIKYSIQTCP